MFAGIGVRTGLNSSRIPDVSLVSSEEWRNIPDDASAVIEVPLILAVEVVSPGAEQIERDYTEKVAEYQATGIPEYWIVDPIEQKITVLVLDQGRYTKLHVENFDTKTLELNALERERTGLRKYKNPIEKNLFPHTWKFYESALASAETLNLDVFRLERWNPFQQSLKTAIAEMRKSYWVHMTYDPLTRKLYYSYSQISKKKSLREAKCFVQNYIKFY